MSPFEAPARNRFGPWWALHRMSPFGPNPSSRSTGRAALATLAMGVLFTACRTAPPAVAPQALPTVPDAWTSLSDASDSRVEVSDRWWQQLGSPQLNALVDEALRHNYDLRAALASVDAAEAQARIQGADKLPSVNLGLDAARRQQVFVGLPVPGSDGVLTSQSSSFSTNLSISWEADLWGRVRAGYRAAGQDLQAARADYQGVGLSLAANVTKTWIRLAEAERLVTLGQSTVDSRRRTRERVEARFRRGVAPSVDVRLARANVSAAEGELAARRRSLDSLRRQLEILVGRQPTGTLQGPDAFPELPPAVDAGLPADLLTRRPDLAAAEARMTAAGWRVAEARAAFYPRLSLTGTAGTSSDDVSDLLDGDFSVWSLAGNLLQPIFQGGRLRAAADLAEAGREASLAQYAQTLLRALSEVETTLASERLLGDEVDAFAEALEQAQKASELAEDRYRSGVGDYLALLESQRQAFDTETRLLGVHSQRLRNRIDLHLALGGEATTAPSLDTPDTPNTSSPSHRSAHEDAP